MVNGLEETSLVGDRQGALPKVGASSSWGHDGVWAVPSLRLPMIITDEVADLSARYGTPVQRSFNVQADYYIYSYRFNKVIDRRDEI